MWVRQSGRAGQRILNTMIMYSALKIMRPIVGGVNLLQGWNQLNQINDDKIKLFGKNYANIFRGVNMVKKNCVS